MEIVYGTEQSLIVQEETEGWENLVEGIKNYLPNISQTWELDIASPPFATNLTLLYSQENTALEEL
ncbi:hypothetical protein GO730_38800 [Spirosoma sp. HMF3257]|uniref:Uncharacterized protein n=1 Tax=Spirosoma telluris TaxID=2183553 RepID=A0A327NCQ7_9BACT|nr:hypothetical protein [Spirosoma telluris]RAI72852.1 hypothetical protein HMF3257_38725 [Spirosoma telluris]